MNVIWYFPIISRHFIKSLCCAFHRRIFYRCSGFSNFYIGLFPAAAIIQNIWAGSLFQKTQIYKFSFPVRWPYYGMWIIRLLFDFILVWAVFCEKKTIYPNPRLNNGNSWLYRVFTNTQKEKEPINKKLFVTEKPTERIPVNTTFPRSNILSHITSLEKFVER